MVKNISFQIVFFFVLFHFISWIRETSLLETNQVAPQFELPIATLPATEQQSLSLENLKGKPSILYFWAPWCSVCRVSMPNLESYYQKNKDDVNVVGIVLNYQSTTEVEDFLNEKSITLPTLLGDAKTSKDFLIQGFPTYYVLDANGVIKSKSMGYSSEIGLTVRTLTL